MSRLTLPEFIRRWAEGTLPDLDRKPVMFSKTVSAFRNGLYLEPTTGVTVACPRRVLALRLPYGVAVNSRETGKRYTRMVEDALRGSVPVTVAYLGPAETSLLLSAGPGFDFDSMLCELAEKVLDVFAAMRKGWHCNPAVLASSNNMVRSYSDVCRFATGRDWSLSVMDGLSNAEKQALLETRKAILAL